MARKFPGLDLPRIIDPTGVEDPSKLSEVVRRNLLAIDQNLRELLRRGHDSDLTDEELEALALQLEQAVEDAETAIALLEALTDALGDELDLVELDVAALEARFPIDLEDDADREGVLDHDHGGTGKAEADMVGQAGKAPIVNATEDGYDFGAAGGINGVPADAATRTAGNVATVATHTNYQNVDTAIDLEIEAVEGDRLEVGASLRWSNEAALGILDAATIVGGSPVNYVSGNGSGGNGVLGWMGESGVTQSQGGAVLYTVQAGDLASGTVTLRLRFKSGSATAKTIRADSTAPLYWYVKNIRTGIGNVDLGEVTFGSSFPPTPAAQDRHWHTTHNLWFFYDGTRWLSEKLYTMDFSLGQSGASAVDNTSIARCVNPFYGVFGLWGVDAIFASHLSAAATWVLSIGWRSTANAITIFVSRSTAGDAGTTWIHGIVAIDAAIDTGAVLFDYGLDEQTGTSTISTTAGMTYRLIGT